MVNLYQFMKEPILCACKPLKRSIVIIIDCCNMTESDYDFFCGSFMFFLSCICYAFVRVCLYVLCGHLLGKGWPLGSHLWCLTVSLSLSHWYPRSGVVLDCIDSWSLHPYLLWAQTQQQQHHNDRQMTKETLFKNFLGHIWGLKTGRPLSN